MRLSTMSFVSLLVNPHVFTQDAVMFHYFRTTSCCKATAQPKEKKQKKAVMRRHVETHLETRLDLDPNYLNYNR